MVKLEDFYGAIEDILAGQGVTVFTPDDVRYKSFTGGIISPFMLSIMGESAKEYFALSDAGVTANAEFCVGLTSRGDGWVDGIFRFIFSEMLITASKSEDFFEITKGERLLERLIDSTHFSVKYVTKANGIMCDVVIPKIISTTSKCKFTEFKRIGRGARYAQVDVDTSWTLPDDGQFADEVWDKVKEAVAFSYATDKTMFGCDPVSARISADGLQRELEFEDMSLPFNQHYLGVLSKLGLTRIYVKSNNGKAKVLLHFEED